MNISEVRPSGYCRGVGFALAKVKKAVRDFPNQPIFIVGMLVHNKYIVEALSMHNVITLDDSKKTKMELIDEINSGVVIFTAHGISEQVKQKAIDKGLTVIDATCEYVLKTHDIIREYLALGYDVFYIGKKNHPESDAVLSIDPDIKLITNATDVENVICDNDRILVTTQTTMSIYETRDIIEKIMEKFPHAEIAEEICDATKRRQNAVAELKGIDVLIVVGDPKSNNTNQLAKMGLNSGIKKVLRIETARDLKDIEFDEDASIAVASGASTPQLLTRNVIKYLETKDRQYLTVDLSGIIGSL